MWVNIDGTPVPMTRTVPLSATNRTTLSFRLPRSYAEARVANDTGALVQIYITNRANTGALSETVYWSYQGKFDLAQDKTAAV